MTESALLTTKVPVRVIFLNILQILGILTASLAIPSPDMQAILAMLPTDLAAHIGKIAAGLLVAKPMINTIGDLVDNGKLDGSWNSTVKVLVCCLALSGLTGCAWIQTHQTQIGQTVAVIVERAATSLGSALLSAAINPDDQDLKANYLDGIAGAFWKQPIVTSDDVTKIVNIWAPNDGEQWKKLASGLATLTSNVLTTKGQAYAATIGQNIASGLNKAAEQGRQDAAIARAQQSQATALVFAL